MPAIWFIRISGFGFSGTAGAVLDGWVGAVIGIAVVLALFIFIFKESKLKQLFKLK